MTTYTFIDAANIIYGTKNPSGNWKIDFQKLYSYLTNRYQAQCVFYFAGADCNNAKQQRFYKRLRQFGYITILKPVKYYPQPNGSLIRKANCDVDLTFYLMKTFNEYQRAIVMTGDGDFLLVLQYLLANDRSVKIIANAKNTARELKKLVGENFIDLINLKDSLHT